VPTYAIVNNYCFGEPPQCLLELTDLELAYVTPVKVFGYCFSYTGGKQRCIKGSLSYMRVEPKSIVSGMVQLEALGLGNDIVVIYYGELTKEQDKIVRSKTEIRVDKIISAIEWLLKYKSEWKNKNVNIEDLRKEISQRKVCIVDNSVKILDSENENDSNIEKKEEFRVFFPDGSLTEIGGGQGNVSQFKELVRSAKKMDSKWF
jgi:hypothetical protein